MRLHNGCQAIETTAHVGDAPAASQMRVPGKATVNGVEKVPLDPKSFRTSRMKNGRSEAWYQLRQREILSVLTLKVVDGKATAVFTPTDKTYAGEVAPVTIKRKIQMELSNNNLHSNITQ